MRPTTHSDPARDEQIDRAAALVSRALQEDQIGREPAITVLLLVAANVTMIDGEVFGDAAGGFLSDGGAALMREAFVREAGQAFDIALASLRRDEQARS